MADHGYEKLFAGEALTMKSKAIFIFPPHSSDFDKFKKPYWNISRLPPLGLIAIGSYLHAKGHDVKIIDCRELIVENKTNDYIQPISKIVNEFKPDMIGINIYTAVVDEAKKISCELKKNFPDRIIIAGGPHPAVEPELTLQQNQYLDAICIGPGEEVCLDILDGKKINNIHGLMHRDYIHKFEKRTVDLDIDKYPFPNYGLANRNFYTDFTINTAFGWGFKSLAAVTSRSCPYSCKFCASNYSRPFRYHSPEYVVEMAKYLSTYDIDVITFCDDTIACVKDRLYNICEGFIHSKVFWPYSNLRWVAAMRANEINPDILNLMKKAGCFAVGIGIESGSDRMLKVINKKTTVEMNRRACAYAKEAGLYLAASFMLNLPGETEAEMKQTIAFIKDSSCGRTSLAAFRPLPGSPFYYESIDSNILSKDHIDWSKLGDLAAMPTLFSDVRRERFEEIFDEAYNIANSKSWVSVHEDTLLKYPKLIRSIALRAKVKISKSDNYESSTHIAYTPFSIGALPLVCERALLQLYVVLPFKLRRQIKAAITKLAKTKCFGGWLWRY